jgi:hypothetical protein
MMNRIQAAALALLAPVLALAQQATESPETNTGPVAGSAGMGSWLLAIVLVAAIALLFWGFRTMYLRRFGPHDPQEPTPRGP